jgi:hypothetical protein
LRRRRRKTEKPKLKRSSGPFFTSFFKMDLATMLLLYHL